MNRSEAVQDLMRAQLVSEEADSNKVIAGTLTIIYDHHQPNLTEKLVEARHHAGTLAGPRGYPYIWTTTTA
jgi:CopG family nickel-responsive transcriptional regulator